MSASWRIIEGDCRDTLASLDAGSVQACVTSPPFFGLRDYGTGRWEGGDPACDHLGAARGSTSSTLKNDGRPNPGQNEYERDVRVPYRDVCGKCGARRVDRQIGLEPTPDEFVAALVGVFREVRRVLRDDGTVWLNLGDSYNNRTKVRETSHQPALNSFTDDNWSERAARGGVRMSHAMGDGVKEKDLLGIPWMVAFALRADGWYLRSDIIWSKLNPMPESVTDRPTKAHEYLFLLSKGPRYFYDAAAVAEPHLTATDGRNRDDYEASRERNVGGRTDGLTRTSGAASWPEGGRNKRSVWTVATQPYPGAHFATFPPKLIEPCILAGCPERMCGECGAPWERIVEREPAQVLSPSSDYGNGAGRNDGGRSMLVGATSRTVGFKPSCGHDAPTVPGTVLDPFAGAGTTGMVALRHGRSFIGCELSADYVRLARDRIIADSPLLNSHAEAAA